MSEVSISCRPYRGSGMPVLLEPTACAVGYILSPLRGCDSRNLSQLAVRQPVKRGSICLCPFGPLRTSVPQCPPSPDGGPAVSQGLATVATGKCRSYFRVVPWRLQTGAGSIQNSWMSPDSSALSTLNLWVASVVAGASCSSLLRLEAPATANANPNSYL